MEIKLYDDYLEKFNKLKSQNFSLDMSRGKPSAEQLNLSSDLLTILQNDDCIIEENNQTIDCRNYGGLDGILPMKKMFANLFGVSSEEVLVGGNSSLTLMYDSLVLYGLSESAFPKSQLKILCPSPGYDRHFLMSEYLGLTMIPINMTQDGPDISQIKEYIADPAVIGIWCVPVFSNPQGITYSDKIIDQLAALKPATANFKILWDNAYIIHSFDGEPPKTLNLLRTAEKYGNYDIPIMFTSFSKITFPGAGVSAMAASEKNLAKMRQNISFKTVGPDKINQLRHVKFFEQTDIFQHMKKHGEILAAKFNVVLQTLTENFADNPNWANWIVPKGGYFVSVDVPAGCAKRTVELCKQVGLMLTPAGATFPYGNDPLDQNIRLAPSFPSVDELKIAMEVFCTAVKVAALERVIKK
ncbi:MAG: aminotransferase [Firmicutes bacterium]|nr:aminotransferase [Bacillota bacterium]